MNEIILKIDDMKEQITEISQNVENIKKNSSERAAIVDEHIIKVDKYIEEDTIFKKQLQPFVEAQTVAVLLRKFFKWIGVPSLGAGAFYWITSHLLR